MTQINQLSPSATGEASLSLDRLGVAGRLIRIARPRSETYYPILDPDRVLGLVRAAGFPADIFSFSQPVTKPDPVYNHFYETESHAILKLESYEQWWKQTINDKTRNMVRKAAKKDVQIEVASFSDELALGIKDLYDECPIRQGKRSRHYGKPLEVIKREHGAFLEHSEFIAARLDQRLIGFAKVVFREDFACIMNLIALLRERDKSPTNALLARVVERCTAKGIKLLHYGVWSRRGFGDFKLHHGFECRQVPRYYVPLTSWGALAIKLGLHRPVGDRLPEGLSDWLAARRAQWYGWRYPLK